MNILKPKKFDLGDYTAYLEVEGEVKTFKGEPVMAEVETGEIDSVTGEKNKKLVEEKYKYTCIKISKNYPEGEKPANAKDREGYMMFPSSNTKEKDWVGKDSETKKIIECEFDYIEADNKMVGTIKGKPYTIDVESIKKDGRIFQVYSNKAQEAKSGEFPF